MVSLASLVMEEVLAPGALDTHSRCAGLMPCAVSKCRIFFFGYPGGRIVSFTCKGSEPGRLQPVNLPVS